MFDAVGVPDAAERQIKQLPVVVRLLVDLGDGELIRDVVASNLGQQRDAVPEDGRVAEYFDDDVVDVRLLVVNAPASDDFDLPLFAPGAAHVDDSRSVMK